MSQERKPVPASDALGALGQLMRTLRLVWRLMQDPRVPGLPKLIIPAAILYVLSPIDLVPDMILGLGQIDDVAILFLSISFFIELCPPDVVAEHRKALAAGMASPAGSDEEVVEGTYRVVSDDDRSEHTP